MSDEPTVPWQPLLDEAGGIPDGLTKLAILEEAVRLADMHGDINAGFEIRLRSYMWNAVSAGQPERMLVAFAWCLAQSDRQPDVFEPTQLLWSYSRWVIGKLRSFTQFSRQQIADALDDMEARYRRAGRSLRVVAKERCQTAMFLGDRQDGARHFEEWQRLPMDQFWDDLADECCDATRYLLDAEREDEAFELAKPICTGQYRSQVVPHNLFGCFLIPLAERGRWDEAMRYHVEGYRLVGRTLNFLGMVGCNLEFLTFTENFDAAVRCFEEHLALAAPMTDALRVYWFYLASIFFLGRLREHRGDSIALRIPKTMPIHDPAGRYDPARLVAWLDGQTLRTAAAFDARAGNDWFSHCRKDHFRRLAALRKAVPLPEASRKSNKGK